MIWLIFELFCYIFWLPYKIIMGIFKFLFWVFFWFWAELLFGKR